MLDVNIDQKKARHERTENFGSSELSYPLRNPIALLNDAFACTPAILRPMVLPIKQLSVKGQVVPVPADVEMVLRECKNSNSRFSGSIGKREHAVKKRLRVLRRGFLTSKLARVLPSCYKH
eukprot:1143916-Pelagomonas_calceolata.AAC.3